MKERATKQQQVQHLFWRAGFGATPVRVQEAERQPVRKIVRELLKEEKPAPLGLHTEFVPKKELKSLVRSGQLSREAVKARIQESREQIRDLNAEWVQRMASGKGALREKMALFWHGHFACRVQNARSIQQYINVIRDNALGNFGDLLLAVSKSPAMLQFLNNQQNRKNAPNENFAREVMELFTLGHGRYTEQDIKEAARAFTGWGFNTQGEFVFRRHVHDEGEKTVFGKTGRFLGEDMIRLLLEKKETALFVTGKLYRFLVNDQSSDDPAAQQRIARLSDQFFRSGYDISGLLETIFTSDWFYEPTNVGTRIKSPVELLVGLQQSLGVQFRQKQPILFVQRTLGQVLLYPPNVAGWPGGRNWIDSSSLLFRMKLPDYILQANEITVRPKDDGDVNTELLSKRGGRQFAATVDWANFEKAFKGVPEAQLIDELAQYLLQQPLLAAQRALVLKQLKPESDRSRQIQALTTALMSLPEYQLC